MDEWIRQAELWGRQAEAWIRQQPPEQIYVAAAVVALTVLVLIAGTVPNLECASCPALSAESWNVLLLASSGGVGLKHVGVFSSEAIL